LNSAQSNRLLERGIVYGAMSGVCVKTSTVLRLTMEG